MKVQLYKCDKCGYEKLIEVENNITLQYVKCQTEGCLNLFNLKLVEDNYDIYKDLTNSRILLSKVEKQLGILMGMLDNTKFSADDCSKQAQLVKDTLPIDNIRRINQCQKK